MTGVYPPRSFDRARAERRWLGATLTPCTVDELHRGSPGDVCQVLVHDDAQPPAVEARSAGDASRATTSPDLPPVPSESDPGPARSNQSPLRSRPIARAIVPGR